jgi:hypothetical protein
MRVLIFENHYPIWILIFVNLSAHADSGYQLLLSNFFHGLNVKISQ